MKTSGIYSKVVIHLAIGFGLLCVSGTVLALTTQSSQQVTTNHNGALVNSLDRGVPSADYRSVIVPLKHAQANSRSNNQNGAALRSKAEVMQEVKSRYNGQVVKISLNERSATYSVRVLLPNGKVKNLSVSAKK